MRRVIPSCYMLTEFHKKFENLYRSCVEPAALACRLKPVISLHQSGEDVLSYIKFGIDQAAVIVCNLTSSKKSNGIYNPNTMWEAGYADKSGKSPILLLRAGTEIPFNLRSERITFYPKELTAPAAQKLTRALIHQFQERLDRLKHASSMTSTTHDWMVPAREVEAAHIDKWEAEGEEKFQQAIKICVNHESLYRIKRYRTRPEAQQLAKEEFDNMMFTFEGQVTCFDKSGRLVYHVEPWLLGEDSHFHKDFFDIEVFKFLFKSVKGKDEEVRRVRWVDCASLRHGTIGYDEVRRNYAVAQWFRPWKWCVVIEMHYRMRP